MSTVRIRKDQAERIAGHATATAEYAAKRLFRGDFSQWLEWNEETGLHIHAVPPQNGCGKSPLQLVSLSPSSKPLKRFFGKVEAGTASEAMRLVLDAHFATPDAVLEAQIEAAKKEVELEWARLRSLCLHAADGTLVALCNQEEA